MTSEAKDPKARTKVKRGLVLACLALGLAFLPATGIAGVTPGTVWAWGDDSYGQCDVPANLTNAIAVAGGASHSVALRSDGTVVAWGDNTYGQTNVPSGLSDVVAIAAGGTHSLALKSDGTVVAWGSDTNGEIDVPSGLSNVVAISAGGIPDSYSPNSLDYSVVVLGNGTVMAWGNDTYQQIEVPSSLSNVVAVAAGAVGALALKNDVTLATWGSAGPLNPASPPGLSNVVAIAGPGDVRVAATASGSMLAWSSSPFNFGETNVPPALTGVVAVAAGTFHGMALAGNGRLTVWGADETFYNQFVFQSTPPPSLPRVSAIGAGSFHSLAIAPVDAAPINQPPPQDWVRSAGGPGADMAASVAVDPAGNCYVAGTYGGATAQFGATTLTNRGSRNDIFLAKYDSHGNLLWVTSVGGTNDDGVCGIGVDPNGNCYLSAYITGGQIDCGGLHVGVTNTNAAGYCALTAKYSSGGTVLWAKAVPGLEYLGFALAVEPSGDCFVTGTLNGTMDFGGGVIVSSSVDSGFLAKYDKDGNPLWAVSSSAGRTLGENVAVDAEGNSYWAGNFTDATASFGGYTVTNRGLDNVFLVKCDPNGNVIWVTSGGGNHEDAVSAIATDASGNSVICGVFTSDTSYYGNLSFLRPGDLNDIQPRYRSFIVKYDSTGKALWARTASEHGGAGYLYERGVVLDSAGNSYVSGCYNAPFISLNESFTVWLTNAVSPRTGMFVAKYDPFGTVIWAKGVWGDYTLSGSGRGIGLDAAENIYITGAFSQTRDFDGTTLTSAGDLDVFVARLSGPPQLSLTPGPAGIQVSWPTNQSGFVLESASSLSSGGWMPVAGFPVVSGGSNVLASPNLGNSQFFRLRRPY